LKKVYYLEKKKERESLKLRLAKVINTLNNYLFIYPRIATFNFKWLKKVDLKIQQQQQQKLCLFLFYNTKCRVERE